MDNIFFDRSQLKYCGKNVIIGKTVRIRYPELVEIHDNVIIDDFVFISTGLIMEEHTTIMPNSMLTGGRDGLITFKKYSGISSHCALMCGTHDLRKSIHLIHQDHFPQDIIRGNITLEEHALIGCNSVIMPGINIGQGVRVGVHSFVNKNLDPWTMYIGSPARSIGPVDREHILNSLENFKRLTENGKI